MGKRKRIASGPNPFELKDSSEKVLECQNRNATSKQDGNYDFLLVKKKKLEMKLMYEKTLESIDRNWREIEHPCTKYKCTSARDNIDSYEIARNELKFGKSVVKSTQDIKPLNLLTSIKDFNLNNIAENVENVEFVNDILKDLYFLAAKNNLDTAHTLLDILNKEHDIFSNFKKRKMKRNFPRCQTVCLLAIVSRMYSTDNRQHPVLTPAMIFMADILATNFYSTYDNLFTRLLICEIVLNMVTPTKGYIPEALKFLKNVLQLALPEKKKGEKDASPKKRFDLIISKKVSSEEIPTLYLHSKTENLTRESKKVGVIFTAAKLTFGFATLYKDYPLVKFAFQPLLDIFTELPVHLYPVEMEMLIKKIIEFLNRDTPPLRHLTQTIRQTELKMIEPVFKCKYESIEGYERQLKNPNTKDNKNKTKLNEQRDKLKRVKQKIRREERCFLKEIRKSAKAAASVKLKEKQALDKERQSKTAKIYNELAVQECEFKKMLKKQIF